MERSTLPHHDPEAQSQAQVQAQTDIQSQTQVQSSPTSSPSLMHIIPLVVQLITLACLIVSMSLMASNSVTIKGYNAEVSIHFNDIYSYRYALATTVIGLAYTLLQLPFSIYRVMRPGKLLPNHAKLVIFEFLGDKVVLGLLGTGVGAAFGVTLDLKKNLDSLVDGLEQDLSITTLSSIQTKLDDFFNRAYFPAIFLLIAFLTCGVSSIFSSLALANRQSMS